MMSENENFDGPRWYSTNFEKPCMLKWLKCLKCLSQVLNSHQNWLSKVPWIWLDFNHWKQGRAEYGCIMVITGLRTLRSVCLGEMTIPLVQLKKERMTSPCKVLLVVARIIVHILLVISWFSMRRVRNADHVSVGFSVRSESGISRREDFECLRACTCFGQQNQNQKDYEIPNKPPWFSIRINQMLKQTNKYTLSSGQCMNCIDLDSLFSWMPNIFQITDLGASFTFPLKFTWFTMSLPEKAAFFFMFEFTPKSVSGEVDAIIFTQKPSWI